MRKLLFSLFIISMLGSCKESDEMNTITVQNTYSIDIPVYLEKATGLNEDASLQYKNELKEFYVLVINEEKDEVHNVIIENSLEEIYDLSLDGYTNLIYDGFTENVENIKQTDFHKEKLNNCQAQLFNVEGTIDNIDIFFSFAFIEGKEQYYQIMIWTLLSKKDKYKAKMAQMISSFKEL